MELADPDLLPAAVQSCRPHSPGAEIDEQLEALAAGFHDIFRAARRAGSSFLESANQMLLQSDVAQLLAPEADVGPPTPRHLPIIGIMGSGTYGHEELAEPLGRWLAAAGFHLLTGGGRGVMEAATRAFTTVPKRSGFAIGIIPCSEYNILEPKSGYPNDFVEIPIMTHLPPVEGSHMLSRNHINALTPAVVIALPGSSGTASEVQHCRAYNTPVCIYSPDGIEAVPGVDPSTVVLCRSLPEVIGFVYDSLQAARDQSIRAERSGLDRLLPPNVHDLKPSSSKSTQTLRAPRRLRTSSSGTQTDRPAEEMGPDAPLDPWSLSLLTSALQPAA